jgi:hypothetical protein
VRTLSALGLFILALALNLLSVSLFLLSRLVFDEVLPPSPLYFELIIGVLFPLVSLLVTGVVTWKIRSHHALVTALLLTVLIPLLTILLFLGSIA